MPIALVTGPANAGKAHVLLEAVRGYVARGRRTAAGGADRGRPGPLPARAGRGGIGAGRPGRALRGPAGGGAGQGRRRPRAARRAGARASAGAAGKRPPGHGEGAGDPGCRPRDPACDSRQAAWRAARVEVQGNDPASKCLASKHPRASTRRGSAWRAGARRAGATGASLHGLRALPADTRADAAAPIASCARRGRWTAAPQAGILGCGPGAALRLRRLHRAADRHDPDARRRGGRSRDGLAGIRAGARRLPRPRRHFPAARAACGHPYRVAGPRRPLRAVLARGAAPPGALAAQRRPATGRARGGGEAARGRQPTSRAGARRRRGQGAARRRRAGSRRSRSCTALPSRSPACSEKCWRTSRSPTRSVAARCSPTPRSVAACWECCAAPPKSASWAICWPGWELPACSSARSCSIASSCSARRQGVLDGARARALWEAENWPLERIDRVREAAASRHAARCSTLLASELQRLFCAPRDSAAAVLEQGRARRGARARGRAPRARGVARAGARGARARTKRRRADRAVGAARVRRPASTWSRGGSWSSTPFH